uniref:Uncharacterized protein n=1 Tax=Oryzias latipes TaxID=8090 RepID=A0A286P9X0_ORYLA|nr:hypothetical protein [Oryzias latipes]
MERRQGDEPTVYSNIVRRDGVYVPIGLDLYFDVSMSRRLEWLNSTNGGRDVHPDDNSYFAQEMVRLGMPRENDETGISQAAQGRAPAEPTGHSRCFSCGMDVVVAAPGETYLNQHAFVSGGACPVLTSNYTPERIAIELGQARFTRGLIAHPQAVWVPAGTDISLKVHLTHGLYVTLSEKLWCYMCGRCPGEHGPRCYHKIRVLAGALQDTLLNSVL